MDHRCRQSLRATVEAAWLALGGPACIEGATDLEDATVYLDYLEAHDEAGSIPKLAALEEGLARLYALPDLEADDTLQIMTIHKAKGLEFDCVIVPGLGRSSRSNDKKLFMWMEHPRVISFAGDRDEGSDLLLAPIQETGTVTDRIYSWLEKLDGEKEHFEDERLLYVAATRAKARLHLLGSTGLVCGRDGVFELKPPAGKALLSKIWPVVKLCLCRSCGTSNISSYPFSRRWGRASSDKNTQSISCYVACIRSGAAGPAATGAVEAPAADIAGTGRHRIFVGGRNRRRIGVSYTAGCSASRKTG